MDIAKHTEEIWKDIAGWEGLYTVSNMGRVRRAPSKRSGFNGLILKPQKSTAGYPIHALWRQGKRRNYFIHILVAEAFLPPRPTLEHEVNHIDANKKNPHIGNLEWVTRIENSAHRCKLGHVVFGESHTSSKLKNAEVVQIRQHMAEGVRSRVIAARYNVSEATISLIKHGHIWKHI